MCLLDCSALQQSFHAAGVFLYVHGGLVSGAGQDVQNFILPFQLCLCLQGKVLQLHQHLFEFLGLSLTDRWLEDMHLQLGQISC